MSLRSWRNALVFVAGLTLTLVLRAVVQLDGDARRPGAGGDSGAPASNQPAVTTLFSKSITSITVEIDYAPGAEPYVGHGEGLRRPLEPLQRELARRVRRQEEGRVPAHAREDGEARRRHRGELHDARTSSTSPPPIAPSSSTRTRSRSTSCSSRATFTDDAGTEQKETLGVSIGDTGVIGMFKPAIKTPVGNPTAVPQFVEQLALIHFFGHAVGFVDNGVPVGETNKAHIDTENAHHCTNKQCAMSFANESVAGAVAYAKTYIRNPEAVLLGQECLSDARLLESKLLTQ